MSAQRGDHLRRLRRRGRTRFSRRSPGSTRATADRQLEDILNNGRASDRRPPAGDRGLPLGDGGGTRQRGEPGAGDPAGRFADDRSSSRATARSGMLATDSTLYRETTADGDPVPGAADRHSGATPGSTSRSRCSDEQAAGGAGGERRRNRVPAAAGARARAISSSATPTTTGAFPRGTSRTASRPPQAALRETAEETGLDHLILHGPIRVIDWHFRFRGRHIHKYCHFFLFESPDGEPCPQVDEGITACQWRDARSRRSTILSYDNARGVLKRAGEMVRTLVAIGAGRPAQAMNGTAQRRSRGTGSPRRSWSRGRSAVRRPPSRRPAD